MSETINSQDYQSQSKRKIPRVIDYRESSLGPNISSKRRRVTRACDQCRNTRAKCDGEQPTCMPCTSASRTCTYTTSPKKRGIQAGYVRSLELTLAWVLTTDTGAHEALRSLLSHRDTHDQAIVTGKDVAGADRLYDQWKQSEVAKGLELLLSGQEIPDTMRNTAEEDAAVGSETFGFHDEPSGPATCISNSTTLNIPSERLEPAGSESVPYPTDAVDSILPPSHPLLINNTSDTVHLPRVGAPKDWHLLDAYFSFTHCWFPVAERSSLLKTLSSYPEGGLQVDLGVPGSGDHAELHAALALAAYQYAKTTRGNISARNMTQGSDVEHDAEVLFQRTSRLVSLSDGVQELGHVRALLLFSLLLLYRRRWSKAWLLVGFAIRLLFILNSDVESKNDNFQRVAMGCVILDTILSAHLNRTPYLRKGDVIRIGFPETDSLDEWQAWSNSQSGSEEIGDQACFACTPGYTLSIFNALTHLIDTMGPVFNSHHGMESSPSTLRDWKDRLPQNIQLNLYTAPSTSSPQILLLHSVFAFTVLQSENQDQALRLQAQQKFTTLCDLHAARYGFASMPPIYLVLLEATESTMNLDADLRSRVTMTRSNFDACHSPTVPNDCTLRSHNYNANSTFVIDDERLGGSTVQRNIAPVTDSEPLGHKQNDRDFMNLGNTDNANFANRTIPSSSRISSFPTPPPMQSGSIYKAHHLTQSSATASVGIVHTSPVDLDILFDDLMDSDSVPGLELQPEFMQNLGFASEFTSTDAFYEQLDPLSLMNVPSTDV